MFFHSYGDLGMILGLIARNNGLKMGVHGLYVRRSLFFMNDRLKLEI